MEKLTIDSVGKQFRDKKVLQDISLECKKGEIVGIVGHNGCGKTVLFKCVCGLLRPTSGTIQLDDKVLGKDVDMLPSCGVIIEEPAFIGRYSAMKNLRLLYMINQKKNENKLREVLTTVGLDPDSRKRVSKYSLGMRQRLAIAQAIMEDPEVLVLDEPMNGLDHNGVAQMRELFLKLKEEGKIILMASHNKEDIEVLCDVVVSMENGRIIDCNRKSESCKE